MTATQQQTPLRSRTVGEIAATMPGATGIFRQFNLDFCCGGDVALEEAAREGGIDVAEVERALAALAPSAAATFDVSKAGELIDHILTHYHEVHRRELPELMNLARKVEAVHAGHPNAPRGLADLLSQMLGELEVHMKKEELILFPAMRRRAGGGLDAPIAQMRHDHDDHGEHLRRLAELTGDLVTPQGACRSWQALYVGAAKFREDLMDHIHLENNVLFPAFEGPPRA